MLRNPVYVVLFRDVLAIAVRNAISMRADVLASMSDALERYAAIVRFVERLRAPGLLVSTEKVLARKEAFVDYLVDYLGLGAAVGPEERQRAVDFITLIPPYYLDKARLTFEGELEQVMSERVAGWAIVGNQPAPAKLVIRVNGSLVGTTTANVLREDLKEAGKHRTGLLWV